MLAAIDGLLDRLLELSQPEQNDNEDDEAERGRKGRREAIEPLQLCQLLLPLIRRSLQVEERSSTVQLSSISLFPADLFHALRPPYAATSDAISLGPRSAFNAVALLLDYSNLFQPLMPL